MSPGRVASNSVLILASEVLDRLLRFVLVIVAARLLGDVDYGKISFAIAFSSLFLILADFGLHQLLIREIAREPGARERLLGNGLVIKIGFSGLTALCIFGAAQLTGKPDDVMRAVYVIGATQIVGSLAEYFSTVFQGLQRMKYVAVASLVMSVSNTLLGVSVLLMGHGFLVLAWMYLLSRGLKLVYCVYVARAKFIRIALRFEAPLVKVLLLQGATFGILRFFSIMYTNVDSTMLSLMIGDEAVGWYTAAYRLIFAMMVLPVGIMRAVYPALSAHFKNDAEAFQRLVGKAFKLLFWTGTSIATVVMLTADRWIGLLFGSPYLPGVPALQILVWSTAVYFAGTTMTHVTRAAGRQGFTAKVVAASAFLNLGLNFVLIPRFSLVGAAFATLVSELFTFCFHLWFVGRYIVKPPFFHLLPRVGFVCATTGAAVWAVADFNLLTVVFLALAANLVAVWIGGLYAPADLRAVIGLVQSKLSGRR